VFPPNHHPRRLQFVLALGLALFAGRVAAADPLPDPAAIERLARLHYEAGKQAFDLGRFADAAAEFQRGYDLSSRPLFLLNLAHTAFRLEHYAEAAQFCRRYLASSALSAEAEAKELMARAEMHQRLHDAAESAPPAPSEPPATTMSAPPPPDVPAPPPVRRGPARPALAWSGVVVLALGVGALAGGAALTSMATSLNYDFNHPAPGTVYDAHTIARFDSEQNAGIGLLVAGSVAVVGGVTLTVLGWRHPRERSTQVGSRTTVHY
jgi:hypothetical protein